MAISITGPPRHLVDEIRLVTQWLDQVAAECVEAPLKCKLRLAGRSTAQGGLGPGDLLDE
jgi:hypothetical protein